MSWRNSETRNPESSSTSLMGRREKLIARIMERRLDIAFVVSGTPTPGCDAEALWSAGICVALPDRHPLAGCDAIDWELLKDEHFVLGREATAAGFDDHATERIARIGGRLSLVDARCFSRAGDAIRRAWLWPQPRERRVDRQFPIQASPFVRSRAKTIAFPTARSGFPATTIRRCDAFSVWRARSRRSSVRYRRRRLRIRLTLRAARLCKFPIAGDEFLQHRRDQFRGLDGLPGFRARVSRHRRRDRDAAPQGRPRRV